MITRKDCVINLFIMSLFLSGCLNLVHAESAQNNSRPNIVIFICDDLNKEYFECYGNNQTVTPTASRLAAEGMVFDNAFTGQAICAPSRSMIYTGKYPLRNGAFKNHSPVYEGTHSVCHYLQEASYDVLLCGKSHVNPDSSFPWTLAMEAVEPIGDPTMFTRPAMPIEKLERYFSTRSDEQPFCVMASSYYPHGEHPKKTNFHPDKVKVTRFQKENQSTRIAEAQFCQAIQNSDDELAQLLALLDKHDLSKNTMVLFVSDHGRFGKWTVYDSGLNVPFIVRWPSVVKEATRSKAMVSFADILPTLIEIAGGEPVEDLDGKSFLDVLKSNKTTHQDYVYGVMTNQGIINAHIFPGRMIRSEQYKYIRNYNAIKAVERKEKSGDKLAAFLRMGAEQHPGTPEEELFDLINDPEEKHNLASDPAYAEIKEKLNRQLQDWLVEQNDFLREEGAMPLLATHKKFRVDILSHPKNKVELSPELKNSLDGYNFYQHKH